LVEYSLKNKNFYEKVIQKSKSILTNLEENNKHEKFYLIDNDILLNEIISKQVKNNFKRKSIFYYIKNYKYNFDKIKKEEELRKYMINEEEKRIKKEK